MRALEIRVGATRPDAPRKKRHRGLRRGVATALGLLAIASVAPGIPSAVAAPGEDPLATSPELELLGESQLGKSGLNGNVAVLRDIAVVASGVLPGAGTINGFYAFPYPCRETRTKLVDISDPANPTVVGRIVIPSRVVAADVDAISVDTPTFTGDLLAIALNVCNTSTNPMPNRPTDRGVVYYDITDPANPQFLGRYRADVADLGDPSLECGRNPLPQGEDAKPVENRPDRPQEGIGTAGCASSQISVELSQRADGTVLSASVEPFATASNFPSGDLRIVDVTDPTNPTQVGSFPPGGSVSGFSANGCRPFSAGREAKFYDDGTKAGLTYLDEGLFEVDLADPANPFGDKIDPYPADGPDARLVEGNAAYVSFTGAEEDTAILSDEDFIGVNTFLRIDSTSTDQGLSTGLKFGCEATFTLFDPENTAQIYRNPGFQVPAGEGNSAEIVYTGFGCPGGQPILDANLNEISTAGKIVLTDRGGCGLADKALRAQAEGSIGVVIRANFNGVAFGPDGDPFIGEGTSVPVMSIDEPAGAQLRATLCPEAPPVTNPPGSNNGPPADNICSGTPVTGAMVDQPGSFGGVRALDLEADAQVGQYQTPRSTLFPPPDLGVYSAGRSESDQDTAYVAWHSDGVRILDTSDPANLTEVAHFVPPDRPDPSGSRLPAKALVVGVDKGPNCTVVISDINSGLYILNDPTCTRAGAV